MIYDMLNNEKAINKKGKASFQHSNMFIKWGQKSVSKNVVIPKNCNILVREYPICTDKSRKHLNDAI